MQNGNSNEHTNFILNLMHMHLLADPNAAEVKLMSSLNAMKSVGVKHRSNWRVPKTSVWKKETLLNVMPFSQKLINYGVLHFSTENLEI